MVCLELKPGVAPGSCSCFCQSESSPSGKGGRGLQRGCWPFSDKGKQTEVLLFQYDRYPNTLSLKARQTTAFWCPLYSLLISPVSTHHSLAKLSEEAVTMYCESPEKAQSHIQPREVSPGLLLLMLSSVIREKFEVLQILQV